MMSEETRLSCTTTAFTALRSANINKQVIHVNRIFIGTYPISEHPEAKITLHKLDNALIELEEESNTLETSAQILLSCVKENDLVHAYITLGSGAKLLKRADDKLDECRKLYDEAIGYLEEEKV